MEVYAERALKEDPKDATAQLAIASTTIAGTKEFDLDKEQKLVKAEKYSNAALESLKTETPPNPQMHGRTVAGSKEADGRGSIRQPGAAAALRKKYDVALTKDKTAADQDPDPVILVRLANAYNEAKQPENAITTCDRILAMNDAPAQVKQIAQSEKAKAEKAKPERLALPRRPRRSSQHRTRMEAAREALESRLGYEFHNRELLQRALTHRSWLEGRTARGSRATGQRTAGIFRRRCPGICDQ